MNPELPKCPKCNSKKVAYHIYGMPPFNHAEEMELKGYRVELEGCCVPPLADDDAYVYTCDSCNHGWELEHGEP